MRVETPALGAVAIRFRANGAEVSARFAVQQTSAADLLARHLPELRARLLALDVYPVRLEVSGIADDEPGWELDHRDARSVGRRRGESGRINIVA